MPSRGRVPQCIDRECARAVSEGKSLLSGVRDEPAGHADVAQPGKEGVETLGRIVTDLSWPLADVGTFDSHAFMLPRTL
jgi:hypothetical protein